MKTTKEIKVKVGDVLFRVDPQKLVITKTAVVAVAEGYGSVVREGKNLHDKVRTLVNIALDKFPSENNGFLYFRTEDDAHQFVKLQIGI